MAICCVCLSVCRLSAAWLNGNLRLTGKLSKAASRTPDNPPFLQTEHLLHLKYLHFKLFPAKLLKPLVTSKQVTRFLREYVSILKLFYVSRCYDCSANDDEV